MGSRDALVGGGSAARGGLAWPVPIALGLDRLQPCDARFVPFSAHPSSGGGLLDHAAVISLPWRTGRQKQRCAIMERAQRVYLESLEKERVYTSMVGVGGSDEMSSIVFVQLLVEAASVLFA